MMRFSNIRLYRRLSNLSVHFHSSINDLRKCYLHHLINLHFHYHRNSTVCLKFTTKIHRTPVIHQQFRTFCTKTDKKDVVLDEKAAKQELFHDVFKHNKERFRATEKAIRAKSEFIIKDIKETKHKMKEKMEEAIVRENIYTVPNFLCIARIIVSPYLGYLIVQQDFHVAFALLIAAGVTDLMDGWIARTWNSQSSKLGSFLDPMADKVLIGTLFLTLTYSNLIPLVLTEMIIARDLLLVGAGFVIRYVSLPKPRTLSRYFDGSHVTAELAPTFISKVNTAVQLTLVATTLAAPVFGFVDHTALHMLWYTTGFTTVTSALSYVFSKNTYKLLKRN